MNWDWILPLVGRLGIGSLLNSALDFWRKGKAEREHRAFVEKKEAYVGLLSALHNSAVKKSDENAKAYAHWHARTALVASAEVVEQSYRITQSEPHSPERRSAIANMIKAMRSDLGVDVSALDPANF